MSALRAESLTIFLTERHHWKRGQDVLANCFRQIKLVMLVNGEALFLVKGSHRHTTDYINGRIKLFLKIHMQRLLECLQAAVARSFQCKFGPAIHQQTLVSAA